MKHLEQKHGISLSHERLSLSGNSAYVRSRFIFRNNTPKKPNTNISSNASVGCANCRKKHSIDMAIVMEKIYDGTYIMFVNVSNLHVFKYISGIELGVAFVLDKLAKDPSLGKNQ